MTLALCSIIAAGFSLLAYVPPRGNAQIGASSSA